MRTRPSRPGRFVGERTTANGWRPISPHGELAPRSRQDAPPLCVDLTSGAREKPNSGSLGSAHLVAAGRLPGSGLRFASRGLGSHRTERCVSRLRSSPVSNPIYLRHRPGSSVGHRGERTVRQITYSARRLPRRRPALRLVGNSCGYLSSSRLVQRLASSPNSPNLPTGQHTRRSGRPGSYRARVDER